ncbi:PREDICTED: probable N-acetyltransferase 16 [Nanorana parkeri]|uniref:probable N-acetyltransferase 16 n=1 Tax=Nanorana parkeri TaxID=125878 RepID=UPI0008547DFB|nr:PREDICTED: probable N-acetyltransferase 16 [Nanorana parkeri]
MSESPMAGIDFAPATAEDYEELMSISGGIYKGMDYLPCKYHEWLKDHRRRMFMARSEGKIVGFESFLLVDGGETAVVQGLRVAPWTRGKGVAGIIERFILGKLHSDHQHVKRVRLTRSENPPPSLLTKYKVIHSKAVLSVSLPSGQLAKDIKLLEARLDNVGQLNHFTVLEPAEVLQLFNGAKTAEDLLPGGLLLQGWLPLSTQRSNLEMLFERNFTWIYSQPRNMSVSANGHQTDHENKVRGGSPPLPPSSTGFLSLGTPAYPVPYADATYRFDVDMFGIDPASAKMHVVEQLKLCTQSLPAGISLICIMFGEESLRTELNQLIEGLAPFFLVNEQMLLEMEI